MRCTAPLRHMVPLLLALVLAHPSDAVCARKPPPPRPGALAPAFSKTYAVRGLGGGGGIFRPSISPHDPALILASCDMGGVYRSADGGGSWTMIHQAQGLRAVHRAPYPRYDKNRIYWVTKRHTLCRSDDSGLTWTILPKGPWGDVPVQDLLLMPGDARTLLVSTENGLWRGDGREWNRIQPDDGLSAGGPLLAVGKAVFAAFQGGQIYASHDDGQNWNLAWQAPGRVRAMAGAPDGGGGILLASVENRGIMRSADGGKTWRVVKEPYANENGLFMLPNRPDLAYAQQTGSVTSQELLKSEDGGLTWRTAFTMKRNGNVAPSWLQTNLLWGHYFTGFALSATNPDFAMVTTQGELYATRDGGKSWRTATSVLLPPLPDGAQPQQSIGLEVTSCWGYYFDPHDPRREYIAYTDVGFARSLDQGKSWIWSAKGSPWKNTFYDLAFDPDRPGRIYAAASQRHDIPHYLALSATHPKARVHTGGVVVSDDWGATWQTPYALKGPGALPNQVCTTVAIDPASPPDRRTLYAGVFGEGDGNGDEAGVYKSTDNGATWAKLTPGPGAPPNLHIYKLRLHPKTGALFCLITGLRAAGENFFRNPNGGMWMSEDAGATWRHISAGSELNRWATAFAFDPADNGTLYVTAASPQGGATVGGLYKGVRNGAVWFHILKDPTILNVAGWPPYDHCMSVAVHPKDPKRILVGTSLHGLLYSLDGGRIWRQHLDFPFANVQSLSFHPQNPELVYATTFGAGVWVGPAPRKPGS